MDDGAKRQQRIITFLSMVLQFMMLVSTCEKAEGTESMERVLRHDPATLVELQNAIYTRARPSTVTAATHAVDATRTRLTPKSSLSKA